MGPAKVTQATSLGDGLARGGVGAWAWGQPVGRRAAPPLTGGRAGEVPAPTRCFSRGSQECPPSRLPLARGSRPPASTSSFTSRSPAPSPLLPQTQVSFRRETFVSRKKDGENLWACYNLGSAVQSLGTGQRPAPSTSPLLSPHLEGVGVISPPRVGGGLQGAGGSSQDSRVFPEGGDTWATSAERQRPQGKTRWRSQ